MLLGHRLGLPRWHCSFRGDRGRTSSVPAGDGTMSLAGKGLVSQQRGRDGSGLTWHEMSEIVGGFLSPDGHKSAQMGWQDVGVGEMWS